MNKTFYLSKTFHNIYEMEREYRKSIREVPGEVAVRLLIVYDISSSSNNNCNNISGGSCVNNIEIQKNKCNPTVCYTIKLL